MKNQDQPINPWTPNQPWDNESANGFIGLTKREHFAGLILQGIVSNEGWVKTAKIPDDWDEFVQRATSASVDLADELLKKLERA